MVGEIVYEDERCAVLLHEDWAVRGHAMVVWRRHVENLSDLDEEERDHLMRVHARAERALLEIGRVERAIILKLGIQTPHLHLHIYPVSAMADRNEVMIIIDGKTRVNRDDEFVRRVRERLTASSS